MGKQYDAIDDSIRVWMEQQRMFFVGTAPLSADSLVNLSPKGHDALRVIDGKTLAYLDFGGSGVETIAHIRENGRIVIMMCAFKGPPKIFRFYGKGEVVTPIDKDFEELAGLFSIPGVGIRAIIRIHVSRIQDSCGYGVPNYEFLGDRKSSQNWAAKLGTKKVRDYQVEKNLQSLDGIPAISEEEARACIGPSDRRNSDDGE
jgi:hypothetical protein